MEFMGIDCWTLNDYPKYYFARNTYLPAKNDFLYNIIRNVQQCDPKKNNHARFQT